MKWMASAEKGAIFRRKALLLQALGKADALVFKLLEVALAQGLSFIV